MTNSFKESAYVSAPTLRRDTPELFSVASEGEKVGSIGVSINPYHNRNHYLRLDLSRYETEWAKPLFERLAYELKHPLQVMASSGDALTADFLLAGGFELKRRCFEMEVSENDMVGVICRTAPKRAQKGSSEYDGCCRLLYSYYCGTHEAINPLTAEPDEFCELLPETVLYQSDEAGFLHCAFVEENEIAYVCTADIRAFAAFAAAVAAELFKEYETICFEADDCDEAAMALKALFASGELSETDAYVLDDYAAGELSETDTYVPDEYAAGKLLETDAYVPAGRMSCGFSWNADKPCLLRTGTSADMAKRS